MLYIPLTLLLTSLQLADNVYAGSQKHNQNCTLSHNKLQPGTYAFYSDCDSKTYCNSSSFCDLKQCRKDLFPFGYDKDDEHWPALCPEGSFCPDEGGASCLPQVGPGQPCQLNRDDQCSPPPNVSMYADTTKHGLNVNGSVCINNMCMYANVTINNTCVVENVAYVGYNSDQEFVNIVSRGNCMIGGYCDSQSRKCLATKDFGVTCDGDKECTSYNCGDDGTCGYAAEAPRQFGTYVYILVALGIFAAMFGTLGGLFFIHRKQREEERDKRMQYWREQNAFRQNILQMRETARASLQSLPRGDASSRSSVAYTNDDSSYMPPTAQQNYQQTPPKGSQLRPYFDDQYDSPPPAQEQRRPTDNRF